VTAVDQLTVRIDTVISEPMLPVNLSIVSIASRKAAEGAGAAEFNSGKATIGTGPFKLSAYSSGERYEVVRNDAYWGARPVWQKVVFRIITQDASRIAALLAGEVDLIDGVPPGDAAKLRTNASFAVHQGPTYRFYILSPFLTPEPNRWITDKAGKPLTKNPFRDLRVREALSLGIDRKAIVARVMDGAADPVNQLASASMPAFDKTMPQIPYDPAAAKKLLAEAGYPDGFATTIHCSNDRYPNDGRVCQTLGQMLSRIGIDMKVEAQPKAVYFPHILPPKGDYALGLIGLGPLDGSVTTGLNAFIHTYDPPKKAGIFNTIGYSNSAIDAKIEQLASEFDPAKRVAMETALLREVEKDLPAIPLYSGSVVLASKRSIAYAPRPDEYTLATDARPVK
jgi:peptide/nickel transport system substrate-binding protein